MEDISASNLKSYKTEAKKQCFHFVIIAVLIQTVLSYTLTIHPRLALNPQRSGFSLLMLELAAYKHEAPCLGVQSFQILL